MKVKRGEVWEIVIEGKGHEQNGRRPVLVMQNDIGNRFSPTFTVLPMTGNENKKVNMPTHVKLEGYKYILDGTIVLCEGVITKDFKVGKARYMGKLTDKDMERVAIGLKIHLGFLPIPQRKIG